jgi:hypothetical protein
MDGKALREQIKGKEILTKWACPDSYRRQAKVIRYQGEQSLLHTPRMKTRPKDKAQSQRGFRGAYLKKTVFVT